MNAAQTSPRPVVPALSLSLVVHAADEIARGIHRFELRDPAGAELAAFTPGAHLEVRVPCGVVRTYSLCNDAAERDRYVIAVKHEPVGRGGSASLVAEARPGTRLAASPPRNNFELDARARNVLFIAGGIGITPIMPMLLQLDSNGQARCKLVYCTRSPEVTAFRDELLAPRFHGRVAIHHDGGDPARAFDLWPLLDRPAGRHLYCCGPRSMMEAVRDMTGHWPSSAVHFESFVDGAATHKTSDHGFRVRLARSGVVVEVPADRSILEALRAAGHEVASSCESGTCGTCRTRLLGGDPDHRDLVLTDAERADHIMLCVSRARSGELVLDR
jgi:phthalate 4,5-dioxygenase reductase subunit